ncbi:MAG: SMP-30/gluconolactonase/LRE family protein [Burkholderiaceae bacterium]|nr:SMP-30/gluconolactonase/LRE family protein [Burkholderiaceae bacterium]MCD8515822.1 SMP-30/gluconolactonase/LRE family protein [Burkholderiaceae bacterium]MCD8536178.1 SMP-30/gluconolactonase/LRE family protein [Burkholderiaceae bacterium]MCD8564156.1 SMP-30/gluconolactonase/LRE family protein [Burkholderiaceae bacterium]
MYFLGNSPLKTEAQVWTQMPARFRQAKPTAWAAANRGGVVIDSFLEGPLFDPHGSLYVTDIPHGRIFKISPDKQWELIIEYEGEPNGLKWLQNGVLLIADYLNGLMQLDVKTREIKSLLPRRHSESFKGVNDLTFDSRGNLYFTDQGQTGMHDPTGRVYRLSAEGQLTVLLANVPSPNGLVLSPDEKIMFVAATRGNEIWRTPLMADGGTAKVGRFFMSHGPMGPDGLAMDVDGCLFIANPGLGCVWRIDSRGEPTHVWTSPTGHAITNLAFGGIDNREVFVTESESGCVLRFKAPVPGTRVHSGKT